MNKAVFRAALIPALVAGGFILLDLAIDRWIGGPATLNLPHIILATTAVVIALVVTSRAIESRKTAEAALRRAHVEMETRVHERTNELARANQALQLEITERERAEAQITHLASFPQFNPNPVIEMDASGAIKYHNSAATAALAQIGAGDDCRAFCPKDMAAILQGLRKKAETRHQREVQVGGAVFSETIQVIPAFRVARIYAFDITQRKRAEEALRSAKLQTETEKRHLEAVLQALPVGVVITDAQGGVLLTNGMDEQVWGPRPVTLDVSDYAQYKAWWADSGRPVELHEWASAQAVQKGEPVFGQVLEIQRFDGGRGFILNSAVPIRGDEGRIIGSAVAIQDITELRFAEQALRASEEKYRLLFQNMAEGFGLYELLFDQDGKPVDWRILEVNDAYTRHTGIARDQIVGRRASERFPEAVPEYLPRFARVVANQTSLVFETYARAVGRHQRVVTFPAGDHRFASTIEDMSERKSAEEALRTSEAKFAAVFRFSPDGLIIAKADDGTFLDVNEAFAAALGYSRPEILAAGGKDAGSVLCTDVLKSLGELVRNREPVVDHELDLRTKDGRTATMLVSLAPIEVGEAACMLAVAHDITKRKQFEEELRQAQAELAQVAEERARTEERQRLARELHDSVSQALYGVSLGVNTALTLLETDRPKVLEALHYTLSQAHAGLTEMRALIFELRPESLQVEGLVTALTKQTAAVRASRGVEVTLNLCTEPDVPLSVKEALYRIAQQSLNNAAKHSRANRLEVRLSHRSDGLELEVSDDGVGFDPQAQYPGHLGLQSMRERAVSIGGKLEITSAKNHGTQIRVHIPISPAGEQEGEGIGKPSSPARVG